MKILLLPGYYKPERVASSYLMENTYEAFAKAGYRMVLYTPVPTRGVSNKVRQEYKKRLKEVEYNGYLNVNRFRMIREGKNPVQRAFRYALCMYRQYRFVLKEKDSNMLLLPSTPPLNLWLISAVKKKRPKLKIIYNLQDIFPDSLVNTGLSKKNSFLWKIGRKMEDKGYRAADKIVVISEDFKRNIMDKGVPEDKIVIVRNWVDENAVLNVERDDNTLFDEYRLDRSKFYVCYSGNIGHTQNMDMLLNVAKELADHKDIGFIIVGDGAEKEHVSERITKENISNVFMLPFQPYERISEVFSLGDCGLIISKPGVGNNSVPSKTWSIMSAGRPVLASFDKESELGQILLEQKCGLCVDAGRANELKQAILHMKSDSEQRIEMGKKARDYIERYLSRKTGTGQWVSVIKEMEREAKKHAYF